MRSFRTSPLARRRTLIATVATVLAGVVTAGIVAGFAGHRSPAPHRNQEAATPGIPLPALVPAPAVRPGKRPVRKHTRPLAHPAAATPGLPAQGSASAQRTTAPHVPPGTTSRGPTISARYFVTSQSGVGFQGEVVVVNRGARALAGWQIVVALEGDTVTSVENASGFVSNGILLMQPAPGASAIAPDGGTLRVFFTAEGAQTVPLACAFNGIMCG